MARALLAVPAADQGEIDRFTGTGRIAAFVSGDLPPWNGKLDGISRRGPVRGGGKPAHGIFRSGNAGAPAVVLTERVIDRTIRCNDDFPVSAETDTGADKTFQRIRTPWLFARIGIIRFRSRIRLTEFGGNIEEVFIPHHAPDAPCPGFPVHGNRIFIPERQRVFPRGFIP